MISVEEAERILFSIPFKPEETWIPLLDVHGRILARDITTDTDLPSFDRVMMDGVAIRYADWQSGIRQFAIQGVQQAGEAPHKLQPGHCIEVMTGAVCPIDADCIIPYEEIDLTSTAAIRSGGVKYGQHIHRRGSDKKEGDVLVRTGSKMNAAHQMIAASAGYAKVPVYSLPRVHLFSTGDELVEVNEKPLSYQIRRSNVYGLRSLLQTEGITCTDAHLMDDRDSIRQAFLSALEGCDLILLSGGVSKGKFDFIPQVLEELGVEMRFHGINQKPGKPFWFGNWREKFIFAFPGNPVSTMMCAARYLIPWLRLSFNQPLNFCTARLTHDFEKKGKTAFYLQVRVEKDAEGQLHAMPFPGAGSGDFANLALVNGFAEISSEDMHVATGTLVRVYYFDHF